MNMKRYNKLMRRGAPKQHPPEWQTFLEFCESYLEKHGIKNPIVVELGTWRDTQKKFYEQLLNAHHIGIDITGDQNAPDILGNTHDPKTIEKLKGKLGGKPINILFIDASHRYKNVKRDFAIYAPLCSDIIAIHDIELGRYQEASTREVWKFWDELRLKTHAETQPYTFCPVSSSICPLEVNRLQLEEYKNYLFISIHQYRDNGDKSQKGIGLVIKK